MPFTRFILPLATPRLLGLAGIALLFLILSLVDSLSGEGFSSLWVLEPSRLRDEPWRLVTWCFAQEGWVQASGNAVGLAIGLSMMARCVTPIGEGL